MAKLENKTVAIIVDNYFEQIELTSPKEALEGAGVTVHIIATKSGEVQGLNHIDEGDSFTVDSDIASANPAEYDAVVVPGGVINSDNLRINEDAQTFLKSFESMGKPMAVICHGPWLVVSSNIARGKKMTSYHTLKDDVVNAGGEWVDEEVVVDGNLITSRNPDDLPAFNNALISALSN